MISVTEAQIDAFIAENRDAIQRDIAALVAIPSVSDTAQAAPGAPFGPQVALAMRTALQTAADMGLETADCEGYMGYAQLTGESEKQLAIIAHLDVVPAGNGWDADPFTLQSREGYWIGRGVADDKGPAVLALYTAKFFKQLGQKLPYTLRILLGGSEETGMEDLHYYLAHYPMPAFCFTPDAEFPVCNGEKGGFNAYFEGAAPKALLELDGGTVCNAVPDLATALVRCTALPPSTNAVTVTSENGCARLTAHGKGGHASMPDGTVNAIGVLVNYMLQNRLFAEEECGALHLLQTLLADGYGKALGIDGSDGIFTPLTCVGGVVKLQNGRIRQSIDIRYPTHTDGETLRQALQAAAQQYGCTLTDAEYKPPFYIAADSAPIRTLIDAYNEITGKAEQPFTMGGGTYARFFANAVSFGPETVGEETPSFVGTMHGANEGMAEKQLLQALKIYITATARLMQLPL